MWPDLDWRKASIRSFELAFSHHDVQSLFETFITYRGLAGKYAKLPHHSPNGVRDNCTSAISKIYNAHADLVEANPNDDLKRGLRFPVTNWLLSPTNWAKCAVGPFPFGTYLFDKGWIRTCFEEALPTE